MRRQRSFCFCTRGGVGGGDDPLLWKLCCVFRSIKTLFECFSVKPCECAGFLPQTGRLWDAVSRGVWVGVVVYTHIFHPSPDVNSVG